MNKKQKQKTKQNKKKTKTPPPPHKQAAKRNPIKNNTNNTKQTKTQQLTTQKKTKIKQKSNLADDSTLSSHLSIFWLNSAKKSPVRYNATA